MPDLVVQCSGASIRRATPSNKHDIHAGQPCLLMANGLSQTAFDAVSIHGIPNLPTHGQAEPRRVTRGRQVNQHQVSAGEPATSTLNQAEIRTAPESDPTWEPPIQVQS